MANFELARVDAGHAQWKSATLLEHMEPVSTRHEKPLTSRQHAVLTFIRAHLLRHGYPPTQRQIAQGVGLSAGSSVQYQLQRLQASGALNRRARSVRGLRLAESPPVHPRQGPPALPDDAA